MRPGRLSGPSDPARSRWTAPEPIDEGAQDRLGAFQVPRLEKLVHGDENDACDAIAEQRRADLLATALRALDPIHREVVLLRDIEGLSAPEAAARLGISVQALKSRLHRARVNLRDHVVLHAGRF